MGGGHIAIGAARRRTALGPTGNIHKTINCPKWKSNHSHYHIEYPLHYLANGFGLHGGGGQGGGPHTGLGRTQVVGRIQGWSAHRHRRRAHHGWCTTGVDMPAAGTPALLPRPVLRKPQPTGRRSARHGRELALSSYTLLNEAGSATVKTLGRLSPKNG